MQITHTANGLWLRDSAGWQHLDLTIDELFTERDPRASAAAALTGEGLPELDEPVLAPLGSQEVWAAGVTYERSRTARMDEAREAGGADFYDRVYHATRPELFMKATPHRVVGPEGTMRLRADSSWMVPEPELALAVSRESRIFGYTIGNDLSCRDIEGENPLYLPQAKIFDGCCALGPCLVLPEEPLPPETGIHITIERDGASVFQGDVDLGRLRKTPEDLVSWLYRESSFPAGCILLTGTGIVPPDDFSLASGDVTRIAIDGLGELRNVMG